MREPITLRDVAEKANVSTATVSRVINGNQYVSSKLKKSVNKAVDELGYIHNGIARSLKTRTTQTIAFVTFDISNPYVIAVTRAVEELLFEQNYTLLVCSTKGNVDREKEYLKMLMERSIDALILHGTGYNEKFVMEISKQIPVILVHRRCDSAQFHGDYVDSDNEIGTYRLTKQLLALEHQKIFIISGDKKASTHQDRLKGFISAMAEAGITVGDDYPYQFGEDFRMDTGYTAIEYLLAMKDKPTAILAFNNTLALGALKGLSANNIHVPEDISIACYNDINYRELMIIRPTVYYIDPAEVGECIGSVLLERLKDDSLPYRELFISGKLIPGNAVSPPCLLK